jgi:hypothetical protein
VQVLNALDISEERQGQRIGPTHHPVACTKTYQYMVPSTHSETNVPPDYLLLDRSPNI